MGWIAVAGYFVALVVVFRNYFSVMKKVYWESEYKEGHFICIFGMILIILTTMMLSVPPITYLVMPDKFADVLDNIEYEFQRAGLDLVDKIVEERIQK